MNTPNVIWNWRSDKLAVARELERSTNRRLGVIQGVVGLGIGVLVLLFWHGTLSYFILTVSGLVLLLALVSPVGAYKALSVLINRLTHSFGMVTTWILLLPTFYLFFVPFRLLFRRGAHDKLARTTNKSIDTYWNNRETAPDTDSYERQF